MRYMAIDVGEKRTGLAIGDDRSGIVTPLEVIACVGAARLAALRKAVDRHGPDALVVGLPVNMDGSPAATARKVRAVAGEFARELALPVHFFDERLTSFDADERMSQTGLTHQQKKQWRDALAAAAILRDFLAARTRPPEVEVPPPPESPPDADDDDVRDDLSDSGASR